MATKNKLGQHELKFKTILNCNNTSQYSCFTVFLIK